MADSGDSDSDSDINMHQPKKAIVSSDKNSIVFYYVFNLNLYCLQIIDSDEESSSSSSDGESDKCPICLTRLGQQDLASPNSCLHTFCLNCLTEWGKVNIYFIEPYVSYIIYLCFYF